MKTWKASPCVFRRCWLESMEQIEAELGAEMDGVEPVPPVFPREDFD